MAASLICVTACEPAASDAAPTGAASAPPPPSLPAAFTRDVAAIERDLDAYWSQSALVGGSYEGPAVRPYRAGEAPSSACSQEATPDEWRDRAYYCFADRTLLYDLDFIHQLHGEGPGVAETVLAHEWGHHVQALTGVPEHSLQRELQADCYAGAYLAPSEDEANDIEGALLSMRRLVDAGNAEYRQSAWFDIEEHGSPGLRWVSYITGLLTFSDPAACEGLAAYVPREPATLGPVLVAHYPGTDYQTEGRSLTFDREPVRVRVTVLDPAEMPSDDQPPALALESLVGRFGLPQEIPSIVPTQDTPEPRPAGEWLSASYVADVPGQAGVLRIGVMRLYRHDTGDGVLVEGHVLDDTGADLSDEGFFDVMADLVSLVYAMENFLCLPGESSERGSPDYYFACDIEVPE